MTSFMRMHEPMQVDAERVVQAVARKYFTAEVLAYVRELLGLEDGAAIKYDQAEMDTLETTHAGNYDLLFAPMFGSDDVGQIAIVPFYEFALTLREYVDTLLGLDRAIKLFQTRRSARARGYLDKMLTRANFSPWDAAPPGGAGAAAAAGAAGAAAAAPGAAAAAGAAGAAAGAANPPGGGVNYNELVTRGNPRYTQPLDEILRLMQGQWRWHAQRVMVWVRAAYGDDDSPRDNADGAKYEWGDWMATTNDANIVKRMSGQAAGADVAMDLPDGRNHSLFWATEPLAKAFVLSGVLQALDSYYNSLQTAYEALRDHVLVQPMRSARDLVDLRSSDFGWPVNCPPGSVPRFEGMNARRQWAEVPFSQATTMIDGKRYLRAGMRAVGCHALRPMRSTDGEQQMRAFFGLDRKGAAASPFMFRASTFATKGGGGDEADDEEEDEGFAAARSQLEGGLNFGARIMVFDSGGAPGAWNADPSAFYREGAPNDAGVVDGPDPAAVAFGAKTNTTSDCGCDGGRGDDDSTTSDGFTSGDDDDGHVESSPSSDNDGSFYDRPGESYPYPTDPSRFEGKLQDAASAHRAKRAYKQGTSESQQEAARTREKMAAQKREARASAKADRMKRASQSLAMYDEKYEKGVRKRGKQAAAAAATAAWQKATAKQRAEEEARAVAEEAAAKENIKIAPGELELGPDLMITDDEKVPDGRDPALDAPVFQKYDAKKRKRKPVKSKVPTVYIPGGKGTWLPLKSKTLKLKKHQVVDRRTNERRPGRTDVYEVRSGKHILKKVIKATRHVASGGRGKHMYLVVNDK